jgi:hypothetical protein
MKNFPRDCVRTELFQLEIDVELLKWCRVARKNEIVIVVFVCAHNISCLVQLRRFKEVYQELLNAL